MPKVDISLRPTNWNSIYVLSAICGCLIGYFLALIFRPSLLPPFLRLGGIRAPETILFLGTDVVYTDLGRSKLANKDAFSGRSDTIMVSRLDPYRNSLDVLSIPRDTLANIPGYGLQKINAANAYGGPDLAKRTVSSMLELPIDHFVILNVHGLVELINELGGITVEIPKSMHYMDWTAKLLINLSPGFHTLTGNQAMGFVRFRHDELGDIGRVQRQEIFVRALLDRAKSPDAWLHIPRLISIAQKYIDTDMSVSQLAAVANFARAVPKGNQHMVMMPGRFSGTGDWFVAHSDVQKMVAKMLGTSFVTTERRSIKLVVINASSSPNLASRLYRYLRTRGYNWILIKNAPHEQVEHRFTRIIAQKANPEDADQVRQDLNGTGEVINASVGDIESGVTILAGDDIVGLVADKSAVAGSSHSTRHFHH